MVTTTTTTPPASSPTDGRSARRGNGNGQGNGTSRAVGRTAEDFQTIIDTMPGQVCWKAADDFRYLGCNQAFAEMAGFSHPSEILGKNDFELPWKREQAEFYRSVDSRIASTGEPEKDIVEPIRDADGTERWIRVNKKPMRNEAGEIVAVLAVIEDITEARNAAKERERFATVVRNSPDFVAIADPDANILYANPAGLAMLGLTSYEGMRIPDMQPEMPEEAIPTAIANGFWRGEATLACADGTRFPVSQVISAHKDEEGNVINFSTTARDITEAKEAAEALRHQTQAIMDLSTPVVKVWDGVLLLPIVGDLDTARAMQMTERLLAAIAEEDAKVALLDVTGLIDMDTSVARHVITTVAAARILGAEVVITGFSPMAAQTLTQLGVDFSGLRTRGSLSAGMQEALRLLRR